jgi:hypothetical protein
VQVIKDLLEAKDGKMGFENQVSGARAARWPNFEAIVLHPWWKHFKGEISHEP